MIKVESIKNDNNLQYEVHVIGVDVAQVREYGEARIEESPEEQEDRDSQDPTHRRGHRLR